MNNMNNTNRLKIKLHACVNPEFKAAFVKLATDSAVSDAKGEAWAIARSIRKIQEHADDFGSVKRNVAEKLGTPIDNDPKKGFTIPPDKNDEWLATLTPILEGDVELYLDHKILLKIPLPANSRLDAKDLGLLMDVVDEAPAEVVQLPRAEAIASAPEKAHAPTLNENERATGAEAGTAAS